MTRSLPYPSSIWFRHIVVMLALACLLLPGAARSQFAFDTSAPHAILLDADTGQVLYEKSPDERIPPASMSKLMTAYILFEKLANGGLKMDDTFPISVDVWRKWRRLDGSVMFLKEGDRVSVQDLIYGIVVQSGNDACDVFAEGLAGSQENFAGWLNEKAQELGLSSSHFENASGWPDPEHYMTVRDIAHLTLRLIQDFPEYYHYFAVREFTYNGIRQPNRNLLLGKVAGVDGLKTGYVADAGYGMSASAIRDGQRLISVVSGTTGTRVRARETERLLNWGFRNFKTYDLVKKGQVMDMANVWLGNVEKVSLVASRDVQITASRDARKKLEAKVIYQNPVPAPIVKDQPIAMLRITGLTDDPVEVPLLAGESAEKLSGMDRLKAAFNYLLWGASAE